VRKLGSDLVLLCPARLCDVRLSNDMLESVCGPPIGSSSCNWRIDVFHGGCTPVLTDDLVDSTFTYLDVTTASYSFGSSF